MSARKLHNYIMYAYSTYMYNPNLLNLIDELDKLTMKDITKSFSYSISSEFINKYRVNDHKLDFTNKTGNEFCNDVLNYVKTSARNDLNNYYNPRDFYLPHTDSTKTLEKINCFIDMYRYELIGFFFDCFINTYTTYTNKLNIIKLELDNPETQEQRIAELTCIKHEINILLVTDFLTELLTNCFYNSLNMIFTFFDLGFDTSLNNNELSNRLEFSLSISKKIRENSNKYNEHKEKIKSYL